MYAKLYDYAYKYEDIKHARICYVLCVRCYLTEQWFVQTSLGFELTLPQTLFESQVYRPLET